MSSEKPLEFSHRVTGNKATQFVPIFLWIKIKSPYMVAWAVRNLFFYHHWSVNLASVLFSCMFNHNVFSVTGGSQSLTIVFGWNVVIKYVFLALVVRAWIKKHSSLNKFPACLISQAGRISFDLLLCLWRFKIPRNARWRVRRRLFGCQVYYGQCQVSSWR